jgi:spore coat polysaccharide biosynthesis protein SpsF
MGSTRLPGKVLEPIEGRSMLARVVERLRACARLEVVVVAIPEGPGEAALVEECGGLGAAVFAGPEEDVLARFLGAAEEHRIDPAVRITSDCPLIDPAIVDRTVDEYFRRRDDDVDLVSNTRPRRWPRGMDTEVVSASALLRADGLEKDPAVREHVTLALYRRPQTFRVQGLTSERDLSHLRFTVDTEDDLAFVRAVYRELGQTDPPFGLEAVLALLGRRPDIADLNAGVHQKELPE